MLELTRILTMNVADLAQDLFESDAIKGLLAFDATLGVYLGPRSPNTVFNLLYRLASFGRHGMGAFHLPMGGMGSLAEVLTKAAKAAGVEIRTGTSGRPSADREGRRRSASCSPAARKSARPSSPRSADPQRTLLKLVRARQSRRPVPQAHPPSAHEWLRRQGASRPRRIAGSPGRSQPAAWSWRPRSTMSNAPSIARNTAASPTGRRWRSSSPP